jgi:hypothetical protein
MNDLRELQLELAALCEAYRFPTPGDDTEDEREWKPAVGLPTTSKKYVAPVLAYMQDHPDEALDIARRIKKFVNKANAAEKALMGLKDITLDVVIFASAFYNSELK